MNIYDNCRYAIRLAYFGFALIAFGFIIQNKNVNIFYTFSNSFILLIADGALKLGKSIVLNLPLIFMVNLVCKKANSGVPIILAVIGYFTYLITMSLFATQTLISQAYNIGLKGLFDVATSSSYPFETGLIGSFIVAYLTRFAFIHSRHRSSISLLSFMNKDSAAITYNIVYCAIAGIIMAYAYPFAYNALQTAIQYISSDLADPIKIGAYGALDRVLSMLGLLPLIKYPFWFTSAGGSYSSILTGQVITGDVNIWSFIQDATSTFQGCGRFITPYYVINMFMIPAIYLGMYLSMSNKKERRMHLIPMFAIMLLSIIAGNPLPLELSLLFTAPLLLLIYIVLVGVIFGLLSFLNIFLGFEMVGTEVVTAMPGSFPDFIINLRNIRLVDSLMGILKIGIAAFIVVGFLTFIYYRYLAYDFASTGKKEETVQKLINACGGRENIESSSSGLLKLYIALKDEELVSYNRLQDVKAKNAKTTKDGLTLELGVSSRIISDALNKELKR